MLGTAGTYIGALSPSRTASVPASPYVRSLRRIAKP